MVALHLLMIVGALGADETALLNFSGPNCPHCRTMEPVLAKLEEAGMPIRTIDVTQHPDIARRFNVNGIPTFVMLVNGKEANRIIGSTTAEKLQTLFPVHLAPPVGDVRGQSPEATGNYLGERLGTLLGKGQATTAPAADPFTQRQAVAAVATESREIETTPAAVPAVASLEAIAPASMPSQLALSQPAPLQSAPSQPTLSPQQRAMAASVRIKVSDDKGHSLGSGTIIDTRGGEALVITCGHIFRDSQGKGDIAVDLFYPQPRTVKGTILEYDLQRDIAVLSIAPGAEVVSAKVLPEGQPMRKGAAAFSIGCDRGQDPSLRETQISGLNRYQGPPNIEAKGQPVDGRSGGGLFSSEGHLVGVCNAADPADDEGIYAAIETIHWQLAKVGLEELYTFAPTSVAQAGDLMREESHTDEAARRLGADSIPPVAPALLSNSAADSQSPPAASDTELILIVRSKSNPSIKGQVFVIDHATPELLQQLAARSSDPTLAADLALQADRRSALSLVTPNGPVVRGQSRR